MVTTAFGKVMAAAHMAAQAWAQLLPDDLWRPGSQHGSAVFSALAELMSAIAAISAPAVTEAPLACSHSDCAAAAVTGLVSRPTMARRAHKNRIGLDYRRR
jgi:hypothetical protein